jgi:hypothetical protein
VTLTSLTCGCSFTRHAHRCKQGVWRGQATHWCQHRRHHPPHHFQLLVLPSVRQARQTEQVPGSHWVARVRLCHLLRSALSRRQISCETSLRWQRAGKCQHPLTHAPTHQSPNLTRQQKKYAAITEMPTIRHCPFTSCLAHVALRALGTLEPRPHQTGIRTVTGMIRHHTDCNYSRKLTG